MRRYIHTLFLIAFMLVSCAPQRYSVPIEMRYPSKSGIELAGKIVSVVYLENDEQLPSSFNKGMAEGFASSLEEDYATGEGSIGVYRMRANSGTDYAVRDSMLNLLIDTGADVVFLFDTLRLGNISAAENTATVSFTMLLHSFDAMDKSEKVNTFTGTSTVTSEMPNGDLSDAGAKAGVQVSYSFKSQWKQEQYSLFYFESSKWHDALELASEYQWKKAMDIWFTLVSSRDLLKKACAEYNIALACYMLGDMELATEWLDKSDKDNKLTQSDALRKRINARK